jgi:hypothetical protein
VPANPIETSSTSGDIPGLTLFIGNDVDGNELNPDGANGGLFIGSNSNGYEPVTPGRPLSA